MHNARSESCGSLLHPRDRYPYSRCPPSPPTQALQQYKQCLAKSSEGANREVAAKVRALQKKLGLPVKTATSATAGATTGAATGGTAAATSTGKAEPSTAQAAGAAGSAGAGPVAAAAAAVQAEPSQPRQASQDDLAKDLGSPEVRHGLLVSWRHCGRVGKEVCSYSWALPIDRMPVPSSAFGSVGKAWGVQLPVLSKSDLSKCDLSCLGWVRCRRVKTEAEAELSLHTRFMAPRPCPPSSALHPVCTPSKTSVLRPLPLSPLCSDCGILARAP